MDHRTTPVAALLDALRDPETAPAAARALGRRRDPAVIAPLIARYDPNARSRRTWRVRTFGRPADPTHYERFPGARALRQAIVVALGDLGAPALASALSASPVEFLRGDLAQIARRAGPAALDVLLPVLRDRRRRNVARAARVLRDLGDPRAIPALLALVSEHPAPSVAGLAERAVVHLGRAHPAALRAALHAADGPRIRVLRATYPSLHDEQLAALRSLLARFRQHHIEAWLFGGWAVDFRCGAITRPHGDIDLAVWRHDVPRIARIFADVNFVHEPEEGEDGYTSYRRGVVRLDLAVLERDEEARVYTPVRAGRAAWPAGAFDDNRLRTLRGVRARVLTLAALREEKSAPRDDPRVAATDAADLCSLSAAVAERRCRNPPARGALNARAAVTRGPTAVPPRRAALPG